MGESDSSGMEEESPEEEDTITHDECIEPVECHKPEIFVIDSDEDCMLSPKKQFVPPPDLHPDESAPPVADVMVTGGEEMMNESQAQFEGGFEDIQSEAKVENICDSDEEKKGVFKDWFWGEVPYR